MPYMLHPSQIEGPGVFETMRTYGQQPFRLDDHLKRLAQSAELIGLPLPQDLAAIREGVLFLLRGESFGEHRIRIIVKGNEVQIEKEFLTPAPEVICRQGVKLITVTHQRRLPKAKQLGHSASHQIHKDAQSQGAYDALMVDPDQTVRECTRANIFWVKEGQLHTTQDDILEGVTRQVVMELADHCKKSRIQLTELLGCSEVFITHTSGGIVPVAQIDNQPIGFSAPGPLTTELMERFAKSTQ